MGSDIPNLVTLTEAMCPRSPSAIHPAPRWAFDGSHLSSTDTDQKCLSPATPFSNVVRNAVIGKTLDFFPQCNEKLIVKSRAMSFDQRPLLTKSIHQSKLTDQPQSKTDFPPDPPMAGCYLFPAVACSDPNTSPAGLGLHVMGRQVDPFNKCLPTLDLKKQRLQPRKPYTIASL